MRPYRGKRKYTGEWVFGSFLGGRLCHILSHKTIKRLPSTSMFAGHEVVPVIRETVGQSTGLEDKNGVEVWAGGWLRHYGINTRPMGQVKFYNGAFCAFWQGGRPERLTRNLTRHFEFFDDNPELLEAEKEN